MRFKSNAGGAKALRLGFYSLLTALWYLEISASRLRRDFHLALNPTYLSSVNSGTASPDTNLGSNKCFNYDMISTFTLISYDKGLARSYQALLFNITVPLGHRD